MKSIDEFVKNNKPGSSKFKDIHEFIGRPQVDSYFEAEKKFNTTFTDQSRPILAPQKSKVSLNPADSPVMKSIDEFVKNQPVKAKKKSGWNGVVDNPIGRGIGKGIKAVDVLSQDIAKYATPDAPMFTKDGKLDLNTTARQQFMKDNPQKTTGSKGLDKALNIAGVAGSFYTPGAGSANVAGLFGAAEKVAAKFAPNLVGNAAGRVIQKAATGAATGIPLGVGGSLAQGQDDKQALEGGLYGAALGGLGGVLGGTVGELVSQIKKERLSTTFDKMFPAYEQAAKNRNVRELTKAKPLDLPALGLPEPKSAIMERELNRRSVLPANTDVIHGKGELFKAEPLGLPNGNFTKPTRLKVNNPTETLDYVMNKIKPQVMEIIEAPTRRDLLVKYIQKNTQVPISEIHNMPIDTLTRLGQDVEDNLHKNMHQIAFDVAKQNGHDLPALLEGQAPSLRAQLAKDTQSQVYGVQPPKIGIQKPEFNVTHNADAAMPVTKIKRLSDIRQEVAATKEVVKPQVEPVKGTVIKKETVPNATKAEAIGKSEPLKVRTEIKRTLTPTERVAGIRANYQNQLKNGNLSPELKKRISTTDKTYEKVTNEDSLKKANEAMQNASVAESKFHGNKEYSAEHVATGYRLIQELDSKAASETNTVLREAYHQRSLNVANKLAKDLTEAGQTVQAANVLAKLSPEGQLLNLTRQAEKNGKSVSVADKVKFQELAVKVQKNAGMGVRSNQFTESLNRAAKGERLTSDDVKKMSDYLASAEKNAKPKAVKVTDDLPEEMSVPRKRDRIVSYLDDAEQAALARIKARKNNLNSLPIGEWADHAIVVSSQIAKGTIKAATHIEDLVKLFGEEIRPVASQVFQKAQSLVKSVSPGISANDMTKANKAFERISGQAKEMNLQEKIVEKYVKENPKVSPKDIDTLRELAKNVTQLSSDEGVKADIAMQKILNSYEKSTSWDKVKAIRYMAMLLNSGTQLVNAASGPIMATMGHAADVFGTMLDIAVHHALGKPRSVTLYGSNPLRFMADYFKHLVKTGAPAGWHGVSPGGIQNAGEIRGLTFKSDYNPLNWAERTLGAVAKGTDYAAYKTIFDSEIRKSGFLDAINSGIKRSDRAAIKAHVEKFVNEPSEKALLDADRIGKNTTFQRSDSIGGQTANFLNGGSGKVKKYVSPVVNAVIPFVRTPINIASTAVTMTPAGILKGLWQLTSKSEASQREAIRTLSLGVTGTFGTSALGYYLSNIGIITGANDSGDKDVDAIKDQAGQGKYRFNTSALKRYLTVLLDGDGADAAEKAAKHKEGDRAFDYNKFQPIAFPLAIGASLGKSEGKPLVGRLSSAGTEAYGSLFGMSTLKGVQDVFQPQYSGTQGEKQIGVASRLAESFFKSFSPSMLAQEARRQDPTARKTPYNNGFTNDLKGYFQSRTPGLSQSLPANKTTLGMDKMNATGFSGQYINPYKSEIAAYSQAAVIISELIDRTGDTSLAPSAPSKKVSGKDKKTGDPVEYAIPQDRYEQLQEELGQAIIVKIMAINQNDSDIKKVEKIKKIYEDTRKIEMDKVKKEFGIKVTK